MAKHGFQKPEKAEFSLSHGRLPRSALLICSIAWWIFFLYYLAAFLTEFRNQDPQKDVGRQLASIDAAGGDSPSCEGKRVYMYTLPPKFNHLLLKSCEDLSVWTNMCPHVANSGLGQPLGEPGAWFATNQFTAEVIFHERMKHYRCLTTNSSIASAFYVPFYAGFDMSRNVRQANLAERDRLAAELVAFLRDQPRWQKAQGRDHFMVLGRIAWDFLRESQENTSWGNNLLLLPEAKNMSMLLIEAHPWHRNEHGIPYPSYFHPSRRAEVSEWQQVAGSRRRSVLFSFAGAPRPGLEKASVRAHIFRQCRASRRCRALQCDHGPSVCHDPSRVMSLFADSVFCLQPQGDSFTRRSIFDSMLAGCIPVFFTEHSAYTQYGWHLPRNRTSYSVFIPEESVVRGNASIEKRLRSFSRHVTEGMRREVIRLIPSLVYADPRGKPGPDFTDAFDIAVDGVLDQINDANNNNPTLLL